MRGYSDPATVFWSRGLVHQSGMVECGKNVARNQEQHPVRGIGESVYIDVRLRKRDEMRYRRWYKMFSADKSGVVLRVVGRRLGVWVGGIALHQRLFTTQFNDRVFCILLILSFSPLLLLACFAFIYGSLPISRTVSLGLVGTWKSFAIETD